MDELMDWLFEYVSTRARVLRGAPLQGAERARLLALSRALPTSERTPSGAPAAARGNASDGVPVQLTAPGGFEAARLDALSRETLRVTLARPLREGAVTIVRVLSQRGGVEYTFPCRVERVRGDEMLLRFDGAPRRTPLSEALRVGWRRPLDLRTGWGRKADVAAA